MVNFNRLFLCDICKNKLTLGCKCNAVYASLGYFHSWCRFSCFLFLFFVLFRNEIGYLNLADLYVPSSQHSYFISLLLLVFFSDKVWSKLAVLTLLKCDVKDLLGIYFDHVCPDCIMNFLFLSFLHNTVYTTDLAISLFKRKICNFWS